MIMKKYTILLTSAGGLAGTYILKHLKKENLYRIVAIDMSKTTPINKWADVFYVVPAVKDKGYLETLKKIINEEQIDVIIPITSYDVDLFSRINIRKKINNVKMLLMDYNDHNTLHNKETCYKYLSMLGVQTPKIYGSFEEASFPCILKPLKGSGSKNTVKIEDMVDYRYWSHKIENSILIEYVDGKEYTVDCLFDRNGKCMGANVRERMKTSAGGVVVTRNDYSQNIDRVIHILENTNIIKGPINFQYKRTITGDASVFDFNTRFASGGLPLTVASGFDIPNRLISMILDDHVEPWYPDKKNDGLTMIRYYEEVFINKS